jgi:hypothetical protein
MYGIVVKNTEQGFSILLNIKIEANSKEDANNLVQTSPPLFIPEFMYHEPFHIVSPYDY